MNFGHADDVLNIFKDNGILNKFKHLPQNLENITNDCHTLSEIETSRVIIMLRIK